jgi:hypothetical protein
MTKGSATLANFAMLAGFALLAPLLKDCPKLVQIFRDLSAFKVIATSPAQRTQLWMLGLIPIVYKGATVCVCVCVCVCGCGCGCGCGCVGACVCVCVNVHVHVHVLDYHHTDAVC